VPITFVEREFGSSKMSSAIVREALWLITRWGLKRIFRR
jgi:dolichol-phosphate mannosyltransferase